MSFKDQEWTSIDELRKELSTLGARHPIERDTSVIRTFKQIFKLEPSGGAIVPLIEMKITGNEFSDDASHGLYSWREALAMDEAVRGHDALAWYVSFHNTDPDWGIYIPISSLHYIAERKLRRLRFSYTKKLEIAFHALLHHESMHYAIDRNVAAWEMILGMPLHKNVPDRLKLNGYIPDEEAVANAHKLREMSKHYSRSCISALEDWVAASPAGYSDAFDWIEPDMFSVGLDECVKVYAGLPWFTKTDGTSPGWIYWASQFMIDGPIDLAKCPVFVLDDQPGLGLPATFVRYLDAIPAIVESKKFQKMFNKLPKHIQDTWIRKREGLKERIPAHPEFEKMKGSYSGLFSVRVGDNHRAHIKPSQTPNVWEAVGIGPHKAMGHG